MANLLISGSCSNRKFAEKYFQLATHFMKYDPSDIRNIEWEYVYSKKFDFKSMIIYDSNAGTAGERDESRVFPMFRKDGVDVWQGGNRDPGKAKISDGDIARIAQLYPIPKYSGDNADKKKKNQAAMEENVKAMDLKTWGPDPDKFAAGT